jgi:broad specificity phosphatase PhoE
MAKTEVEQVVYFVRHAQSEHNVAPVFQSPDSPLSSTGIRQAERIAERVSRLAFETLITSTFQRARETAQIIARVTRKQPELSELFVERLRPSRTNGKAYTDEKAAAIWRQWDSSFYTPGTRVEDGESSDDLIARADKALVFLSTRPERSFLVVTHSYFLRVILARVLLGYSLNGALLRHFLRGAAMENTGLTVLRYHGAFEEVPRWRLWVHNDHAHLAD